MKETVFDLFLRRQRIKKVLPIIKLFPNCKLLDVGCGTHYTFLSAVKLYINQGYGIDFKVQALKTNKIIIKQIKIEKKLPFEDNMFDVITMLAVLEHLEYSPLIIKEIERILKPGGKLILTVPSKIAKPVLELLAFRLKIIDKNEIADHKKYYNYLELEELIKETESLKIEKHEYFQFYMNNFCIIKKKMQKSKE